MCTSGCPTQDHLSYAECLRSKTPRVAYANSANGWDASKQKGWDRELSRYRDLVSQGIEPPGTKHAEIDRAERTMEQVS